MPYTSLSGRQLDIGYLMEWGAVRYCDICVAKICTGLFIYFSLSEQVIIIPKWNYFLLPCADSIELFRLIRRVYHVTYEKALFSLVKPMKFNYEEQNIFNNKSIS